MINTDDPDFSTLMSGIGADPITPKVGDAALPFVTSRPATKSIDPVANPDMLPKMDVEPIQILDFASIPSRPVAKSIDPNTPSTKPVEDISTPMTFDFSEAQLQPTRATRKSIDNLPQPFKGEAQLPE